MISRRRSLLAIASAVAAVSLPIAAARAVEVDFSTFTAASGVPANTFSPGNWQVLGVTPDAPASYNNFAVAPGRVAQEITNADQTLFLGPSTLTTLNKVITGDIYFGGDDDYVGLAVGVPQNPFADTASDYLLLQWKGLSQDWDFTDPAGNANFHNTTVGGSAPLGVSLSRVTGVPTADEAWQRASLTMYDPNSHDAGGDGVPDVAPDPSNDTPLGFDTGGLLELARGAASGSRPYDRTTKRTSFEITYTATNIQIKINGVEEFNLNAPAGQTFPEGTLAMYEQSQADNTAYAYWDVRELSDPAPAPGPDLSPAGSPFAAADIAVTTGNTNATSVWSVPRGSAAPSDVSTPSTPNVGDVDVNIGGAKLTKGSGVLLATVRQTGPRQNNATNNPAYYGGVEAPSPSGFNLGSTGLATFAYGSGAPGEWNVDVAVAHFPYATFNGGYVLQDSNARTAILENANNPALYTLTHTQLAMPTQVKYDPSNFGVAGSPFWSTGTGGVDQTVVNLAVAGKHATTGTGILFTIGAKNESNTTGVAVLPDGSWNISVRDSGRAYYGGPDTFEEDNFAFVHLEPNQIAESAAARITGLNAGAPQVAQSWGNYEIDHVSPGVYELVIAGGETYTINSLKMQLSGDLTWSDATGTRVYTDTQRIDPVLSDTAFSVAFIPFSAGDPTAGMLLLSNNGTFTMRNAADTADVTVPTNHFLNYQVGGIPTWKTNANGNWSDAANWRVGVPNAAGDSANFSHAITAPRTVTLDSSMQVANLFFNSPQKYTIARDAGGTTGVSVGNWLGVYGGSHEIAAPLTFTAPAKLEVANGASLKLSGKLRGKVSTLNIAPDATLDITDNILLVESAVGTWDGTKYTGVQGEVARAYDFGAWDLPGITTSMPDAGPTVGKATIGVATGQQAAFLGPDETGIFAGETISGTTAIAMYTWAGDVDLNGYVDAVDYGTIDQWIQFPGTTGYTNGDLNYDGVIDAVDYGIIDNGIQLQGPPISTNAASLASLSAVPEPASLSVMGLAAATLLGRRRRRPV